VGHELIDIIEDEGPQEFEREELEGVDDLFEERAAALRCFIRELTTIPERWVGSGRLDVRLPIAPPSRFEWRELIGHQYPRIWVDLLQRATGKVRWRPVLRLASVLVEIYDVRDLSHYAGSGAKALIDSLKEKTTGRPDRRLLYYFGAIEDDSPRHIDIECVQREAESAAKAYTRILAASFSVVAG
jgi:hypothetical protein